VKNCFNKLLRQDPSVERGSDDSSPPSFVAQFSRKFTTATSLRDELPHGKLRVSDRGDEHFSQASPPNVF
jgi:hypothetical protein